MPRGTYGGGHIELHVFAEDLDPTNPADQAILDQWKKSFEVASCMLFHATDKQAHFAKIHLYTAENGANDLDNFDARVSNSLESSYANGHPTVEPEQAGDQYAFLEGTYMELGKDAFDCPFVILHEFGHFGYALGDEYVGDDDSPGTKTTVCTATQRVGVAGPDHKVVEGERSCIMGVPTLDGFRVTKFVSNAPASGYSVSPGWIVEFCNHKNHDDSNGSNHNGIYGGMSCAEVIAINRQINVAQEVEFPMPDAEEASCPNVEWPPTTDDSQRGCGVDTGPAPDSNIEDVEDTVLEAGDYGRQFASPADRISLFKFGRSAREPRFKPMRGVRETLEAMARDFPHGRKRAAVESILLFSTGREPIPNAHAVARAFKEKGVRVFSIGLGRDRGALQQLAQQTGGAYVEVDVKEGERTAAQNAQRVRAEMARVYDQSRFGAPITIVPRERFLSGSVAVRVERGSKLLKLVLAQSQGSNPAIKVVPPPGSPQRLERTKSDKGGFETVSVRNPQPGNWSVTVEGDVLPKTMELSAYSDNRRISIGISGRLRLREVNERVTLQVVVRAPFAVVDLDVAEVRVTPPGGGETRTHHLRPRRDGVHVMQFRVTKAGAYDLELLIRNNGRAKVAGQHFSSEPTPSVPLFERMSRFQIHVAASR